MSQADGLLVFTLVILILLSAQFSAMETAFSSANKIKLRNLDNDGNEKAEKVLKILEDFDHFLSTVLIGNNIVNISAATIATVLFTHLYGGRGATISTIVMTVLILIFGEITPKSVAKMMPERFAMQTCGLVRFLEIVLAPLSWLFSGWKFLVKKTVHVAEDDSDISDELITMVDEAEKDGELEAHESDLISAAIEFNDLDVKDVLTPRVDVVAVDITMPVDDIEKVFRMNSFSRLPVYETSIDNIVGVIHEKDFYNLYYHDKGPIKHIIKPTIYTSPQVKISALLKQLQADKLHLAVVLDEYGGTQGIITLEDIVEELVGEIWDEHDTVREFYTKVDDNTYLVRCDADIDDMMERFHVKAEEEYDFITVSGWVIHELERMPHAGDEFRFQNLQVTVTKADQRKVIEIKVQILPEEESDEDEDK